MQSAIWKAIALTGVIAVGCYVVYEVHRRMPKPEGQVASVKDFQGLDEQRAGKESGGSPAAATSAESAPPAQGEPGNEPFDPVNGITVAGATSAAPWEAIPQRSDNSSPARDADFINVLDSAGTSAPEVVNAPGSQFDASTPWANSEIRDPSESAAQPLLGLERPPLGADSLGETGLANGESTPEQTAVLGAAGESPSERDDSRAFPNESATGGSEVMERAAPARTRAIQPAGGAEFPSEAAVADAFAADTGSASGGTTSGAVTADAGATGLFDALPDGPGLAAADDGSRVPAGSPDNGPAAAGEPRTLPGLSAVPLVDGASPDAGEGNATNDPFADNGLPELPPADRSSEPPGSSVNAVELGEGLSAPERFAPFDAAESAAAGPDNSATGAGVVLPADAPAEFHIGTGDSPPDAAPANDDPPFIIAPARERRPDRALSPQTSAPPHRDFSGDGTLTVDSPSGPQQPELKIEKVAPPEATVGEPLVYAIRVSNVGRSAAHDVIVEDRIPRGTTLDGTIPRAEMTDKRLLWRLGTIEPGGEQMIRIRVVPTEAGEIGSVATVRFVAEVAAATVITRPELSLEMTVPGEVAVGEQAQFHFKVVNSGATDARDVIIRSLLPRGLEHPDGNDIEYPLGRLRAGEVREIELAVLAKEAGQLRSKGLVAVGSRTYAEQEAPVLVIPSRLLIRREGPARRFVGRKADYSTTVTNRSSRDLQQVTVEEQLPAGLELAAMPKDGQFDSRRRTITWKLPLIRAGESISLTTSVVAQSPGTLESIVRASDAGGNKAALASRLDVAGFSALAVDFEHAGNPGPVSVGEQVSFRLTVKNRGTAPAEGVQALFEIPDHLEFVHADGPVAYTQEGQVIRFSALDEIAAKDETSFNIVLTAAEAGTKRVTAELTTPNLAEPLRNDQAVVVEADE